MYSFHDSFSWCLGGVWCVYVMHFFLPALPLLACFASSCLLCLCTSYLADALLPARQPQKCRLAMRLERLGVEAPPIALGRLGAFKTMET
jgi:hypothetical protein